MESGGSAKVPGESHTTLISEMMVGAGGQVYSTRFDDKLREADPAARNTFVVFLPLISPYLLFPFFSFLKLKSQT